MKKQTTLAAAIALAMAFGPAVATNAFAQSLTKSSIVQPDHSMRSSKLIGMDIYNEKGEKIGTIADILVKGNASEPHAILSVGDYLGGKEKMVEVPLSHVVLKSDKASMPATKATLAAMKEWTFNGLGGGGG